MPSSRVESQAILDAWHGLRNRQYELEAELIEIQRAVEALRPIVEGDGPCAGLSMADAALTVLKEKPDAIWTNKEILERMEQLGWESTAKTPGGVSGALAGALKQLSEQRQEVLNVARGQWMVVTPDDSDPKPGFTLEQMVASRRKLSKGADGVNADP